MGNYKKLLFFYSIMQTTKSQSGDTRLVHVYNKSSLHTYLSKGKQEIGGVFFPRIIVMISKFSNEIQDIFKKSLLRSFLSEYLELRHKSQSYELYDGALIGKLLVPCMPILVLDKPKR